MSNTVRAGSSLRKLQKGMKVLVRWEHAPLFLWLLCPASHCFAQAGTTFTEVLTIRTTEQIGLPDWKIRESDILPPELAQQLLSGLSDPADDVKLATLDRIASILKDFDREISSRITVWIDTATGREYSNSGPGHFWYDSARTKLFNTVTPGICPLLDSSNFKVRAQTIAVLSQVVNPFAGEALKRHAHKHKADNEYCDVLFSVKQDVFKKELVYFGDKNTLTNCANNTRYPAELRDWLRPQVDKREKDAWRHSNAGKNLPLLLILTGLSLCGALFGVFRHKDLSIGKKIFRSGSYAVLAAYIFIVTYVAVKTPRDVLVVMGMLPLAGIPAFTIVALISSQFCLIIERIRTRFPLPLGWLIYLGVSVLLSLFFSYRAVIKNSFFLTLA